MGVLDNTTITVDAILTKKGRELLAQGEGKFKITKFALADDEIDYGLYDVTHPNGSNFYGAAIEGMNLLEAIPNQNLAVKYFLTNNPSQETGTAPYLVTNGPDSIVATTIGVWTPNTENYASELYEFTLSSTQYATIATAGGGARTDAQQQSDAGAGLGQGYGGPTTSTSATSTTGTSITIKCKAASILGAQDRQVSLQIRGVDSGTTQTKLINLLRN